jgi:starch phosphorylase
MLYYKTNARLKSTIDRIARGFNGEDFSGIVNYFLSNGKIADPYMCLADFESYVKTAEKVVADYSDRDTWAKRSLLNIAAAGKFASDRSINEYAENIWNLKSVKE